MDRFKTASAKKPISKGDPSNTGDIGSAFSPPILWGLYPLNKKDYNPHNT